MDDSAFGVPLGRHLISGLVQGTRPVWRWLGDVESRKLRDQIERTPIDRPVYVAGLARAGTTITLEVLASHPHVATHQYRDFPMLYVPYWWRRSVDRAAGDETPVERAHGDRIAVTTRSPEAMEEPLWAAFFPHLHDPHACNALTADTRNPRFEAFYRDHVRKLLIVSGKSRYAAKGNYNLTRLEYLQALFPDARFVVVIRRPREHVASLVKQHKLFLRAAAAHPRSVAHLDRVGHFEFGAHRQCANPHGDPAAVESIEALWRDGQEVRGWARYWALLYGWLADRLVAGEPLRRSTFVLRYEDLCDQSEPTLRKMLVHCGLSDDAVVRKWGPELSRPTYYESKFTPEEDRAIEEETATTAGRYYGGEIGTPE